MNKSTFNFAILFVVLVLAQAVVFNNLILFNTAIAMVFIYMIVILPLTVGTNTSLTIGFLLGLCVDIFSDTPGLNALSCTILSFVRRPVYHLYMPREEEIAVQRPGLKSMGWSAFVKYSLTMSLIYCVCVFMLEAFSFFDIKRLLIRIGASTLYTLIFIYAFDSLSLSRRREKKL